MIRCLGLVACIVAALSPATAIAQGHIVNRVLGRSAPPQAPLVGIDALRADFSARSGGNVVYFGGDSVLLVPAARAQLAAQAMWLRQHPEVVVRIEGHANPVDTRSHALALGERRAHEVRSYLILLGVPAAQLTAVSMGKERPAGANSRVETVLVR
jgi:peptidoglycan-associated lipoprotein